MPSIRSQKNRRTEAGDSKGHWQSAEPLDAERADAYGVPEQCDGLSWIGGAPTMDASLITLAQLATVCRVAKGHCRWCGQSHQRGRPGEANDYVWGNRALLYYKPPSPGKRTDIFLGYTFTWAKGKLGALVNRFRLDSRHADKIEVQRYYAQKTVAAGAGVLFSNTTT